MQNFVSEKSEPKYLISVIARMLDVHPQTLRNYERIGLIKPSRSEGNTRLYSRNDIENIERVLTLTKELGVNIAGVEIILRLTKQIEVLKCEFEDLIGFVRKELHGSDSKLRDRLENAIVQSPYRTIIHTDQMKTKNGAN